VETRTDLREGVVDLLAEERQDDDNHDGYQHQDEGVLDQALASLSQFFQLNSHSRISFSDKEPVLLQDWHVVAAIARPLFSLFPEIMLNYTTLRAAVTHQFVTIC